MASAPVGSPSHATHRTRIMFPLDATTSAVSLSWASNALSKLNAAYLASSPSSSPFPGFPVSMDVWWGDCEYSGPRRYDFSRVALAVESCKRRGSLVQCIMSFHACGGNVGDSVNIPLPPWLPPPYLLSL